MRHDPGTILTDDAMARVLRALPVRMAPPGLNTSLRVIASRERQRRLSGRGLGATLSTWRDRLDLFTNHLMRPLWLPFAGGLFSAVALFSMLVPTYPVRVDSRFDVPTMLTTECAVNRIAPIHVSDDDVIVDVTVDGQGRMIDYTILSGGSALTNVRTRRRLESALLFTVFTPATAFGQPMAGKMKLSLRTSRIDVKG